MIVYIDGKSVSNWTRGEISTGNADAFQFGRWRNDANAYFQGLLDDLRIYNSALDGQEVQQIFTGQDLEENFVEHQFSISADGDPTGYSIIGLPAGLTLNGMTGELTGLPLEVGVFDLNVSAYNLAGEGKANIQLIVNKTSPRISSVEPRGLTSSSVKMSGRVVSDGGEDVQMSLFWGKQMAVPMQMLTHWMQIFGTTEWISVVHTGMVWSPMISVDWILIRPIFTDGWLGIP